MSVALFIVPRVVVTACISNTKNAKFYAIGINSRGQYRSHDQPPCGSSETRRRLLRVDVRFPWLHHRLGLAAWRAERGTGGGARVRPLVGARGMHAHAARAHLRGTRRDVPGRWRLRPVSVLL